MIFQALNATSADAVNLFDGLGTEIVGIIVSFIIGGVSGGAIGFKVGKTKQSQKAGKNSTQNQIGSITYYNGNGGNK